MHVLVSKRSQAPNLSFGKQDKQLIFPYEIVVSRIRLQSLHLLLLNNSLLHICVSWQGFLTSNPNRRKLFFQLLVLFGLQNSYLKICCYSHHSSMTLQESNYIIYYRVTI